MAICEQCRGEMTDGISCDDRPIVIDGVPYAPIRYGEERGSRRRDLIEWCSDCQTPLGGVHHPGCCMERCPRCLGQTLMCGHFDEPDDDAYDDNDDIGDGLAPRGRHCTAHLFRQAGGGTRRDR